MTDDPNKMMQKDREALLKLRQNLSVEADDDSVGSGLLVVHDDRHAEIQNQKEEKRRREREKHNRTMYAMQEYISDLQEQIAYHNQQIDDLNKDRESFAAALEQIEHDGFPEMTPDGKMKDPRLEAKLSEWERKNGKIDRTDSAALIATIQAMDAETVELIQDHEQKRDHAQEEVRRFESLHNEAEVTGNYAPVEQALNEAALTSVYETNNNEIEPLEVAGTEEITERKDKGEGIEKIGSDSVEDRLNSLFASAQELEVTENFNIAASGEIQIPTQEQTQDIAVPSMQININPMG